MTLRVAALSLLLLTACVLPDAGSNASISTGASTTPSFLEPADGRVLHFVAGTVGQYELAAEYARMTGADLAPIGDSIWMSIPGTRSWDRLRVRIRERLTEYATLGAAINLSVSFNHGHVTGPSTAADRDVADGHYDFIIDELAEILRETGIPTLMRIGNEF